MMQQSNTGNSFPDVFVTDLLNFHAFFLSVIRYSVEKHGGSLEKDAKTGTTYVDIPDWAEESCLQELGNLLGPGKPLHGYLYFLGG